MQVAKEMKKQYLAMLPLGNASESFIDILKEAQMEVGNLVWVCECLYVFMFKFSLIFMEHSLIQKPFRTLESNKNLKYRQTAHIHTLPAPYKLSKG